MYQGKEQNRWRKLSGLLSGLARDTTANTALIVAVTLMPLMALVGGGVDLGRAYLAQSQLQQACDAGVLASRKTMGSTVINGALPGWVTTPGTAMFNINFLSGAYGTTGRSFSMAMETDTSITGTASVTVPTTLMRVFGFTTLPVNVTCQARLNFTNLDVMMVLDTTKSMLDTNPSDTQSRITILRDVVRSFHAQLESTKVAGTRIRYGFVPYSTNVNVGSLLANNWVVNSWTYQSREPGTPQISSEWWDLNWVTVSGSSSSTMISTYPATYHPASNEYNSAWYSCDTSPPANTYNATNVITGTSSVPFVGPPAGTKTTEYHKLTETGNYHWVNQSGTTCQVYRDTYNTLVRTYEHVTQPTMVATWRYAPISKNVNNWRTETNGCIEERDTYEINNWAAVNLSNAKDLDIDLVPTGNTSTQWRPMYPNDIYERELWGAGYGSYNVNPVTSTGWFFQPTGYPDLVACPTVSKKLAEMTATEVDTYVNSLVPSGTTYHDIGMIWGGRLISPTGLFASENADVAGTPTGRHLIFLTDGQTESYDFAYGAYGVEPLDRRRWNPAAPVGGLTLDQVVEKRFSVACNQVKNKNVTVWVIAFGTTINPILTNCAGPGHWFEANNATSLNSAFAAIAASMGDLRISR